MNLFGTEYITEIIDDDLYRAVASLEHCSHDRRTGYHQSCMVAKVGSLSFVRWYPSTCWSIKRNCSSVR